MAASRSSELTAMWRAWNAEQRVAAVGASLLIVSTFGPFSWVEAAIGPLVADGLVVAVGTVRDATDGRPLGMVQASNCPPSRDHRACGSAVPHRH